MAIAIFLAKLVKKIPLAVKKPRCPCSVILFQGNGLPPPLFLLVPIKKRGGVDRFPEYQSVSAYRNLNPSSQDDKYGILTDNQYIVPS